MLEKNRKVQRKTSVTSSIKAPGHGWTKLMDLSHRPACRQHITSTIAIYHLLLVNPKADTDVTIPQSVEGWVFLDGWLHTRKQLLVQAP